MLQFEPKTAVDEKKCFFCVSFLRAGVEVEGWGDRIGSVFASHAAQAEAPGSNPGSAKIFSPIFG